VRQAIRQALPTAAQFPEAWRTKLALARRLAEHPTAIFTISALRQPGTEDSDVPWWNQRATRYMRQLLRPGDQVFEWGSGASTVWLTKQGVTLTSIEHDPDWVTKVNSRCPTANVRAIPGTASGQLRSEPQVMDMGQHFFDDYVAAIDSFEDNSFDIVIVDGVCRMDCVRRGAPKVKPGGVLIVDDTDNRFFAAQGLLPGWRSVTRTGFKPSGDLRETTFFHKPELSAA
jgi:predicted O-methyltransferase YrrM